MRKAQPAREASGERVSGRRAAAAAAPARPPPSVSAPPRAGPFSPPRSVLSCALLSSLPASPSAACLPASRPSRGYCSVSLPRQNLPTLPLPPPRPLSPQSLPVPIPWYLGGLCPRLPPFTRSSGRCSVCSSSSPSTSQGQLSPLAPAPQATLDHEVRWWPPAGVLLAASSRMMGGPPWPSKCRLHQRGGPRPGCPNKVNGAAHVAPALAHCAVIASHPSGSGAYSVHPWARLGLRLPLALPLIPWVTPANHSSQPALSSSANREVGPWVSKVQPRFPLEGV